MYQLFGRKKCKNTGKAERFLKERNIPYQFIDLDKKAISPGELKSIFQTINPEDLIDKESRRYEERGLKYMDFDPEEELAEDQSLLLTPVFRFKNRAVAGFDNEKYKKFCS